MTRCKEQSATEGEEGAGQSQLTNEKMAIQKMTNNKIIIIIKVMSTQGVLDETRWDVIELK